MPKQTPRAERQAAPLPTEIRIHQDLEPNEHHPLRALPEASQDAQQQRVLRAGLACPSPGPSISLPGCLSSAPAAAIEGSDTPVAHCHDELVVKGLGILEDAEFHSDEIGQIAGWVGNIAEPGEWASFGGGDLKQAKSLEGKVLKGFEEKVLAELAEVRRLLEAQRANELAQEWYTVPEAAELVGLRPYTLRQACNLGRIPEDWCRKDSRTGKWRVHRDAVISIRNHGLPPVDR